MSASLAPPGSSSKDWAALRVEVLAIGRETMVEMKRDDVPSLSAGVAFRIFLSIFPTLIAVVAVFSLVTTPQDLQRLLDDLGGVAPAAVVEIIEEPLRAVTGTSESGATGALIFGVLAGLWAATSAAVTLMKSLTRARSGEDTRKFVELRATALVITVALFIAIAALMILLVFGSQIQEALLPPLASDVTSPLVTVGRYVGAVLVLQLLFAFIYWVGPDRARRPRWQWVSPGAALGVVGWLLVSYGFSLYTRYFGTYAENPAYTGIAGVIVLLLWLQLTMALLLVGAEVNFVREARRRARADIRDGAGFGLIDPVAALGDADLAPPEPVAEPVPMAPADRSERVRSGPASAPSVGRYAPPPALSDAGRRDGLVRAGLGLLGTAAALITVVRARHRRRS